MTTESQVVYWRDIPAQVKARAGRERTARPLSDRFQQAIDAAAVVGGAVKSDEYLEEWRTSDWEEGDGDPQAVAAKLVEELEEAYPPARLARLVARGGREEK